MSLGNPPSGDDSVINDLSRRLDDVILMSRILLNGTVVMSKTLKPNEELLNIIRDGCKDGLCYAHLRLASPEGREVGEIKLFLYGGDIIACITRIGDEKLYGDAALRVLSKLPDAGIGSVRVIEYGFDPSLLDPDLREAVLKGRAPAQPVQKVERREERQPVKAEVTVAKPEKVEVKEEVPEARAAGDVKAYVARKLQEVGVPITNTVLVESKKYVVLDIICDEDSEIPPPENIVLAAVRHYIEALGEDKATGKVRVTVHHKKTHSETYDLSKDVRIWKLLGAIPEVLWKYSLYVDKLKYKVRKGEKLEISLTLKRHGIYSTANIHDVTKEIYERLKSEWKGDLVVKAKIGAWGMEVKYP